MSATRKTRKKLLTAEQAKAELERRGLSVADFARKHSLPASVVYQVLAGDKKGLRGHSHRAMVLLRMKDGVIDDRKQVA